MADDNTIGESPAKPYVVLARKYRPETFTDLIGQDAMVRTLTNAFATDRIAQGYMLTGVRGVGKTTTARILARALNYSKPATADAPAIDRPTIAMDGYGVHCPEIIASRHADVVEMDAASNTGVDNMREIIESARYKPIIARYKVFIIDEVHMLSKGAFNALLKTLEEPPAHVKFIFATTEIRKVPVTVLSRCQRFDLRRVDVPVLVKHFEKILVGEGAAAEPEALAAIARAAEGSVRDGLSLLDQAIASAPREAGASGAGAVGLVTNEMVRAMLGLADRGRVFDLLELVLGGKPGPAILALESLHKDGAEAAQVLADLADAVHVATRIKIAGADAAGEGLSAEERRRAASLAGQASVPLLSRAWQMLLKGLEEVARAPDQLAAVEMVLIRMAHIADLPAPDEIIRALGNGAAGASTARPGAASTPQPQARAPLNQADGARTAGAAPQAARGAPQSVPPWEEEPGRPSLRAAIGDGAESAAPAQAAPRPARAALAQAAPDPRSFVEIIELASRMRDAMLRVHLEEHVSLVRFEPGRLELFLLDGAPPTLAGELTEKLGKWTNRRWIVSLSRKAGEPAIASVKREREATEIARLKAFPALKAVIEAFPEAEIKAVRELKKDGRE